MTEPIRVGVIGAGTERGWAKTAHLPALAALPEYEVTAVATTRAGSARRAAEQYGAAHAFTDRPVSAATPRWTWWSSR